MMPESKEKSMTHDSGISRKWLYAAAIAAVLVLTALCWLLRRFPPTEYDFWPGCFFLSVSGLYCPGCGSTRALYALLTGDFAASMTWNSFLIPSLALPFAALFFYSGSRLFRWIFFSFIVLWLLFGILRNLPWAPFTLLAPH